MPHGLQHEVRLEELSHLHGGIVAEAFNDALQTVFEDLEDRPALNKAREVTMKVLFLPTINAQSAQVCLDDVRMQFKFSSKLPEKATKVYTVQPRKIRDEHGSDGSVSRAVTNTPPRKTHHSGGRRPGTGRLQYMDPERAV